MRKMLITIAILFCSSLLMPYGQSHCGLVCFDFGPEVNMRCVSEVDEDDWCLSWTNSAGEVFCIGYSNFC